MLVHIGNAPPDEKLAIKKMKLQFQVGRPFVTKHIACSHYVRDICIKTYGLPGRSIVAVPNGIDLDRFFAPRKQRQHRAVGLPIVIGMVASFEVHKDQDTLIRAMAILKQQNIAARLRLVGSGTRLEVLQTLARESGVFDLIDWVARVLNRWAIIRINAIKAE